MSKNIIIQQSGFPEALTVDALRIEKLGVGSEDWTFASGETSSFIKMSIGKNAEVEATDYDAQAITEVDVTQDIYDIETQPDEVEDTTEPRIVSISEGSQPRIFSPVKKVRVNLQAGGTISLLPKSSMATGTLYATKRGHYSAKVDGYVGYSKVYVNVPESSDSGADGGWTDLPDEIRVTQLPNKTKYHLGETINYNGLVVKAYDAHGNIWSDEGHIDGIIPLNELLGLPLSIPNVLTVDHVNPELCPNGISPWKIPTGVGGSGNYYVDIAGSPNYSWYDRRRQELEIPEGAFITGYTATMNNKISAICMGCAAEESVIGKIWRVRNIYYKNGVEIEGGAYDSGIWFQTEITSNMGSCILDSTERYWNSDTGYERAKELGGSNFVIHIIDGEAGVNVGNVTGEIIINSNIPGVDMQTYDLRNESYPRTILQTDRIFRQAIYDMKNFTINVSWKRPRDERLLTASFNLEIGN